MNHPYKEPGLALADREIERKALTPKQAHFIMIQSKKQKLLAQKADTVITDEIVELWHSEIEKRITLAAQDGENYVWISEEDSDNLKGLVQYGYSLKWKTGSYDNQYVIINWGWFARFCRWLVFWK